MKRNQPTIHGLTSGRIRADCRVVIILIVALLDSYSLGQCLTFDCEPGDFFSDDFEDGNIRDADPVQWRRGVWNATGDEVIDGDVHIVGVTGLSVLAPRNDSDTSWLSYNNASIRTQARITSQNEAFAEIGVYARNPESTSSYVGRIDTSGTISLYRNDAGTDRIRQNLQSNIDPAANDVFLQLDLFGNEISLAVWSENQSKSEGFELSLFDDTYSDGTAGLFVLTDGTPGSAEVRWFEIAGTPGVDGDYNDDGIVNAADYTVWRDNLGAPEGTLPNDIDGGVIGQAQFDTWKANFDNTASSPALAENAHVPEPATALLLFLGAVSVALVSIGRCVKTR